MLSQIIVYRFSTEWPLFGTGIIVQTRRNFLDTVVVTKRNSAESLVSRKLNRIEGVLRLLSETEDKRQGRSVKTG